MGDKPRDPLKCWGCVEEHLLKNYPHRNGSYNNVRNIQEVETIGDATMTIPRIYATLNNHQETINFPWLRLNVRFFFNIKS